MDCVDSKEVFQKIIPKNDQINYNLFEIYNKFYNEKIKTDSEAEKDVLTLFKCALFSNLSFLYNVPASVKPL